MAESSHIDSETTPISTASTLSRLLGQAGALLIEAGRLVAALELDEHDSMPTMPLHVVGNEGALYVATHAELLPHVDERQPEGVGGTSQMGGGGGSVLGSPPRGEIFPSENDVPSLAEERLLVSLVGENPLGKRVPSPWDRVSS